MKRDLSLWQFAGFSLTSLGSTLLHFMYEWTNENTLFAVFSAVNESTWEHMKLIFFPQFIFALIQSCFFKEYKNFWSVKLAGISVGLTLIPVLFYTCNGVFGKSPDWFNIAIFFISSAATFLLETYLFKNNSFLYRRSRLSFSVICLIGALFIVFTFVTPHIPLFQDPITGTYGVNV